MSLVKLYCCLPSLDHFGCSIKWPTIRGPEQLYLPVPNVDTESRGLLEHCTCRAIFGSSTIAGFVSFPPALSVFSILDLGWELYISWLNLGRVVFREYFSRKK